MLEPIILGHNPFFGVDHLSGSRGNEKAKRFEDPRRIVEVLRHCHDLGVRGMMMSTHPLASRLAPAVKEDGVLSRQWHIYPLVPYIQKYVRMANEKGLVNMIMGILSEASLGQKFSLMIRGGKGMLGKDVWEAINLLVDIELLPFKKMNVDAIFLHDALTDMALGLDLVSVFDHFRTHVEKSHGAKAGFVTKNIPRLCSRLHDLGWRDTPVMASFNAAGFFMNPDREACERAVKEHPMSHVAMNTLASGRLSPDDAYRYLAGFSEIRSIVVGISRKEHADETLGKIRQHLFPSKSEGK